MKHPLVDESVLRRVEQACSRYERKLAGGTSGRRAGGNAGDQADNFRSAAERAELRMTQVRRILAAHSIPPLQSTPYRNFTLHVDKLHRTYEAETLRIAASCEPPAVGRAGRHGLTSGCRRISLSAWGS
jgi:hypothetical protein